MKDEQIYKILIVDDDKDITELLEYNLVKEGYKVKTAKDGKQALEKALIFLPHLILMDIMMPEMDGIEAARQIRQIPQLESTYILFLTARTEEYAQVAAFDMGGDTYITKPIKPRALLSRIGALFKRTTKENSKQGNLIFADLVIDRKRYTIFKKGQEMVLPKKEFELLYFLARNPNKLLTRDEILQQIWGTDVYVLARTVDVHVRKIREKIGEGYIKTVKGVGYMFETEQ